MFGSINIPGQRQSNITWRNQRMADSGRRKLRINAKNLFLTYPKNDNEPQDVMNKIIEHFGMENISYICVGQEEHQDKSLHLHACVCLKAKVDIKDAGPLLEAWGGKNGNYQNTRSVRDVLQYCQKGGKYVEAGIPPTAAKQKISSQVAEGVRNGQSLEQLDEMDPGYFMMNMKRIKDYHDLHSRKKLKSQPPRAPLILHRWKICIEIGLPRVHKQKQYWIHGPPDTGKTSLVLDLLQEGFRGFQIPENNDFSAYDDLYDFAYIDEFTGQLPAHFLNKWLEGTHMWLNTKGGSVEKRKNLPTFIISNLPPDRVYWKIPQEILTALLARLIVIQTK